MATQSPRINIALLLSSTLLLLLLRLFSQLRFSNGEKEDDKMIPIPGVKSNRKIQALGKFAVDEINEATRRYFQFYLLPEVEYALLSFNEVFEAKSRAEYYKRAIRYLLYIKAKTGKGRERRLAAYVRTVGQSNALRCAVAEL